MSPSPPYSRFVSDHAGNAQVSFYLTQTYLYSFIIITKPWSLINATYFNQTQSVALTVFGIAAGVLMRYVHRYKAILIAGLAIRLLCVLPPVSTRC